MLKFLGGLLLGTALGFYAATAYAPDIKALGLWVAASSLWTLL